jgi:hypothetical protein
MRRARRVLAAALASIAIVVSSPSHAESETRLPANALVAIERHTTARIFVFLIIEFSGSRRPAR